MFVNNRKLDRKKVSNLLTLFLATFMMISSVLPVNVLVADDVVTTQESETVLICEKQEHEHNEDCFDKEGSLVCEKEEHVHDESCFETEETVVVEQQEELVEENSEEEVVVEESNDNEVEVINEEIDTPEEIELEQEQEVVEEVEEVNEEEITNDLEVIFDSISFEEASRYQAKYPFDVEQAIKDGETSFGYSRQSPYDKKEEDVLKVSFSQLLENILFNKVYAADPKTYGIPSQNQQGTVTYVNLIDDHVYGKNSMYATRLIIGGQILYLECPDKTNLANGNGCKFVTSSGGDISTIDVYDKSSVKFYLGFEVHHPGVNGGDILVYDLPSGIVWDDQGWKAIANEDDEENPIAGGFYIMTVNGKSQLFVSYDEKFVNKNSLIDTAIYISGHVDKSQGDDNGKGDYHFFNNANVETNIKDVSKYVTIRKTRSTVQKDTVSVPVIDETTGQPKVDETTGEVITTPQDTGRIKVWYYLQVDAYGENTEIDIDDTYVGNNPGLNIQIDPDSFTLGRTIGSDLPDDDESGITWEFTQGPTADNFKIRINKLGKEQQGEKDTLYLMYAVTFDPVEANYKDTEKDSDSVKTFTINNDATVTSKEYDSFDLDDANFTYTYQGINKSVSQNNNEPYSATWTVLYNNYGSLNGLVDFGTVHISDQIGQDPNSYSDPSKKYYDHDYIPGTLKIYQSYSGSTSTSTSSWSSYQYNLIYWNIGTTSEPEWKWVNYDDLAYEKDTEGNFVTDTEGNKVKTNFGTTYKDGYTYYEKTYFDGGFDVPSTSRFKVEYTTKIDEADLADVDTSDPNSIVMINNNGVYTDNNVKDEDYEEIGVGPAKPTLSKDGDNKKTENELIAKWTTKLNVKDSNVLVKDTYLYDFISIGNTLLTDTEHPLTLSFEGEYYYEATPLDGFVTLSKTTDPSTSTLIPINDTKTVKVVGDSESYLAKKYKDTSDNEIWIVEKINDEGETEFYRITDRTDVYSKVPTTTGNDEVAAKNPEDGENRIYDPEGNSYTYVKTNDDKVYIVEKSGEIVIPWNTTTEDDLENCLQNHAACLITTDYIENNWARGEDGKDHQAKLEYNKDTNTITDAKPNFIINIENIGKDEEDPNGLFANKINSSKDVIRKTTTDGVDCIIYTNGTDEYAMPQLQLQDAEGNSYKIYNSGSTRYALDSADKYHTYTVDEATGLITISSSSSNPTNPSPVSSGKYYNFTDNGDEITLGSEVTPAPTNAIVKKSVNTKDKMIAKGIYTFEYYTQLSLDNEQAQEMLRMNESGNFLYSNKVYIVTASSIVSAPGEVNVEVINKKYISTVTNDNYSSFSSTSPEGKVNEDNLYTTATGDSDLEYNQMAWYVSALILSTNQEFALVDTFSQEPTMELMPDSLKVFQTDIADPKKIEDWSTVKELTNYTLDNKGTEGFDIKFAANTLDTAEGSNVIAFYKTVGDYDNNKTYTYTNTVKPTVDGKDIYPSTKDTTRRTYRILNKFSETDEGKAEVTYTIKINEERLDIDDTDVLTLYDEMGSFLSYHAGSMTFTVVNEDGTKTEVPANSEEYTVDASDPYRLVITVPDETSVIISYVCTVTINEIEPSEDTANKVSMSGKKDFEVDSNIVVVVKEREAVASGKQLTIRLFKYDMDETVIPLPGAVFQITAFYVDHDDQGRKELKILENLDENPIFATTDENGEIVFMGKYDTVYEIKESEAPEGYALSDEVDYFVLPYNYDEEHFQNVRDEHDQEIDPTFYHLLSRVNETRHTIANRKAETTFKIQKMNPHEELLEGAVFQVCNMDDEVVLENLVTDENGEIIISYLEEGDYYLEEVAAPATYERQTKKVEFHYDGYSEYTFKDDNYFLEYIPSEDQYESNILKFTNYHPRIPNTGVK